jgi:type II secretory pathway component GspD/PulD (secretin)
MEYEITLSNFVGQGANGVPPPKQDNTLRADAVTIPSDATIVVGGIVVENERNTVVKVPLLGDIPLLGHLFRDTNKSDNGTVLYVFITPYIMSDPSFQDMRLLTRGPQSEVALPDTVPQIQPRAIEIIAPAPARTP